jgi:hypothetical protein
MQNDWRLVETYSYLMNLGPAAIAWEFLRRNPDYRADYKSLASEGNAALLCRRWGCAANPNLSADQVSVVWLLAPSGDREVAETIRLTAGAKPARR